MVKLNLLRLCSEKTIYRLFILEHAEYQLSLDLWYVLLSTEFLYSNNDVNKTKLDTTILLVVL